MAGEHNQTKVSESIFDDVDITNDYMFSTVMQDSDLCTDLLRVLLPGIEIQKIKYIHFDKNGAEIVGEETESALQAETQKTMTGYFGLRGVRLDVYLDDGKTIYNIEMQTSQGKALPQRSRLYQSHIDISQLRRGENYDQLRTSYLIFICKFDPFGRGYYRYMFQNRCDEPDDLRLNDGAYKLFFNTTGRNGEIKQELAELLKYMNDPSIFPVEESDNDLIHKIDQAVKTAKMSPEWRNTYMIYQMKQREAELRGEEKGRKEGMTEGMVKGRAEGRAEGMTEGMVKGRAEGMTEGMVKGRAEEKKDNVKNLLRVGVTEELIATALNMPLSEVNAIKAQLAN